MSSSLPFRAGPFPALPLFGALAATVVVLGVLAVERSAGAGVVVTAVTIDLVLVIPALHYVLLVRGGRLPAITVLPIFRLSLALAALVLPADDRALYDALAHLARPAELIMAGYVFHRLFRGWRAFRSAETDDVLERYHAAVQAALPPTIPSVDRVVGIIAFEVALVWFATRAWRARPQVPAEATTITGHRTAGYTGLVVGLLMVVAAEVLVVHLLVATWSPTAAWILTALGLYGAVWLIGDLQAVRLRPSWLDGGRLCLRLGLRWTLTVPSTQVRRCRQLAPHEVAGDALRLALPGARRILVELQPPATALGPYGIRRSVTAIELGVDDPDAVLRQIRGTTPR